MEALFRRWGLPKAIKVDNGAPLGDPNKEFVPVLALWLTGLGIKVIWNRIRTPQDNAKVERMQGLTAKWSDAKNCVGIESLEQKLAEACDFQREKYPTRVCKGVPRIKAFPDLKEIRRPYDPGLFDLEKVKQFLGKGMWERRVSQTGQVGFVNQRFYLGREHGRQLTYAQYIPETHQWNFLDEKGKSIREFPSKFTSESIQDLSAFQNRSIS
jgi:transposase InsO family protein